MIVMKFGGSSVADREQINKVSKIIKSHAGKELLVVCSAHKGVTSQLIHSAKEAAQGRLNLHDALQIQKKVCLELGCPDSCLNPLFEELEALLKGISLVRELSDRTLDYVASFGERMSVRVISWYLRQQDIAAIPYDAWDLGLITDSQFGNARPLEGYLTEIPKKISGIWNAIPIVTGYIGRDVAGNITTLGRNGSDFTATLFAEALMADSCEIWSDTDGVMSADPSLIADARNIPRMSYREASELARFGSRILHPASLEPVARARVPLRVMNTNAADHPGTLVTVEGFDGRSDITSIAYKENQTIVTITSSEMFQQSGFLAEVFSVLGRHQVAVDMISTSEISISFSIEGGWHCDKICSELSELGTCQVASNKSLIAVVAPTNEVLVRQEVDVLNVLRVNGVNAEMLSLGYEAINLMILIDDANVETAISSLHHAFFKN